MALYIITLILNLNGSRFRIGSSRWTGALGGEQNARSHGVNVLRRPGVVRRGVRFAVNTNDSLMDAFVRPPDAAVDRESFVAVRSVSG